MEGKKSFLLYCDIRSTVAKLPKEKQAELFMLILDYVNDLNPQTDDLLLEIAFEPIKLQLKRDLTKWNSSIEAKSINGRLGNLKRYYSDLYDQVCKNEITLEDAEILAKTRKDSPSDKPDRKDSQDVANLAVNVTDTVIVNDTVIVTVTETVNENTDFEKKSVQPLEKINPNQTQLLPEIPPKEKVPPKRKGNDQLEMLQSVSLPFGSQKFLETWKTWLEYRTLCKIQYKAPQTMQAALKKLSQYSESVVIQTIENSIANQWQGLFPEKVKENEKRNSTDHAGQFASIYAKVSAMYPEQ